VRLGPALLAGVAAGTVFRAAQWAYLTFQVGAAKYNAVYGSFAALPLFLVWLQLSWLVLLYGAELSFALQNEDTYEFEPDALRVSRRLKTLLSLQIAQRLVARFARGEAPLTARQVSHELEIPIRLVNDILFELTRSGILSATDGGGGEERAFQPACDIQTLTIQHVVDSMDRTGIEAIPFARTPEFTALSDAVEAFRATVEQLPANRLLKEI
jgi:membrane protein